MTQLDSRNAVDIKKALLPAAPLGWVLTHLASGLTTTLDTERHAKQTCESAAQMIDNQQQTRVRRKNLKLDRTDRTRRDAYQFIE